MCLGNEPLFVSNRCRQSTAPGIIPPPVLSVFSRKVLFCGHSYWYLLFYTFIRKTLARKRKYVTAFFLLSHILHLNLFWGQHGGGISVVSAQILLETRPGHSSILSGTRPIVLCCLQHSWNCSPLSIIHRCTTVTKHHDIEANKATKGNMGMLK